ncbi:MAG: hypothetical protein WDW38_003156 [Sanguina aurantia]
MAQLISYVSADRVHIASLQQSAMSSINEMGNVKADIAVLVACLIPQPPPAGHHYQYQEAAPAGPRPSCVATESEFLPCTVTDLDDDAPVTAAAAAATQEGVVSPVVQWHFFQRLQPEGGSEGSQRIAAGGDMGKTKSLPPTEPAADVAGLGLSFDSRHELAATPVKSGEVMMSPSDAGSDSHPTTPVSVGLFLDGTGLSREVCDKEGGVMDGCLGSLVVKKQRGKVGGAVHKLEKVLVQGWRAVVLPWW